ncbi:MAG: response regulator transcription factor [Thermoanaerobaculia bacterium]
MTRILIADDHEMIREALCRMIEEDPAMTVVGQAANGEEALDLCRKLEPDLVLLDVVMPGQDSLEIVDDLKRSKSGVRVLMLTALPEDQYALRCLRAGADGYLVKASGRDELVDAIRRIRDGGKYISDTLATLLAVNVGSDYSGLDSLHGRTHPPEQKTSTS